MLKIVLLAISGFLVIFIFGVGLAAVLMLTGKPGVCDNPPLRVGRDLDPVPSAELAAQLDARWDQFSADIKNQQAVFQATESEVTSRARQYVEDEDVPVDDVFVYYCDDGKGQLAGRVDVAGVGANFVATGTLVLGGEKPVVEIDSVDVGNMPGFVADAVLDLLLDADARRLELDENLVDFNIADGLAELTGGP
ncbi:MAG TPA: hypothetical protein VIB47_10565 [Dehalococcoidia bacterium]